MTAWSHILHNSGSQYSFRWWWERHLLPFCNMATLQVFTFKPSARSRFGRRQLPLILIHQFWGFGGGRWRNECLRLQLLFQKGPGRFPEFTSSGFPSWCSGVVDTDFFSEGTHNDCSEASVGEGKNRAWTVLFSLNCLLSLLVAFNPRLQTSSPAPVQKHSSSGVPWDFHFVKVPRFSLCFFRVDLLKGANYC